MFNHGDSLNAHEPTKPTKMIAILRTPLAESA